VFDGLPGEITQPILITQHMPATFTTFLARHIGQHSAMGSAEARDGEEIAGGRVYVAPGGIHMEVAAVGAIRRIRLSDAPPVNYCKPSADLLFASAARAYGERILCVVLTGMGRDGRDGGRAIVEAGGTLIAQDEATSVVWGMPGAVATAGLCSAVLPLDEVAPRIAELVAKGG
jgi:two-component system chemotaxis response regulator CheB